MSRRFSSTRQNHYQPWDPAPERRDATLSDVINFHKVLDTLPCGDCVRPPLKALRRPRRATPQHAYRGIPLRLLAPTHPPATPTPRHAPYCLAPLLASLCTRRAFCAMWSGVERGEVGWGAAVGAHANCPIDRRATPRTPRAQPHPPPAGLQGPPLRGEDLLAPGPFEVRDRMP